MKQGCLCHWRPQPVAWPVAVSKTGTVKGNHAVVFCQPTNQATGFKVGQRDRIAMQQYNGRAFSTLDVVQMYAVNL